MELFERAKTVRLRSEKGKYLMAEEDEESEIQHRDGSSRAARWSVELLPESGLIRLKSCYGKYLTASYDHEPFGFTGGLLHGGGGGPPHRKHKVVQSLPQRRLDCSVDREPISSTTEDNNNNQLVKLRSCHGTFLRSNGPWRKSVTHDHVIISSSSSSTTTTHHHPKAMLWDVNIMEILVTTTTSSSSSSPEKIIINPPPAPPALLELDSYGLRLCSRRAEIIIKELRNTTARPTLGRVRKLLWFVQLVPSTGSSRSCN